MKTATLKGLFVEAGIFVLGMTVALVVSYCSVQAEETPRLYEDPKIYNEATPTLLHSYPDRYDNKRVIIVDGEITRERTPIQSRLGGVFYVTEIGEGCTIGLIPFLDESGHPTGKKYFGQVCATTIRLFDSNETYYPYIPVGHKAIIAGVFHGYGRAGGIAFSEFITVDWIQEVK